MTQVELAEKLGTVQANVSKTENRHDLLLSTLASYLS
jgi:transcriptional regulator